MQRLKQSCLCLRLTLVTCHLCTGLLSWTVGMHASPIARLTSPAQKLRRVDDIPQQRIADLEASTRQLRQLSCIVDSCMIAASYETSQAQKALLLMPHCQRRKRIIRGIPSPKCRHRRTPTFMQRTYCRTVMSFKTIECWLYDDDDRKRATEWTLRVP